MKKLTSIFLAALLLCSFALAETARVTISDGAGNLVMAYTPVELSDLDSDGVITICDALAAAHDAAYPGGSKAGFITSDQGYGVSIDKLWGEENGGSYGYYVNNASAYSLTDPVSADDHIQAFVYTDLAAWSDTYSFFDLVSVDTGDGFELTLSAQTYDADWNPVYIPVEGAAITIDGADAGIVTDEQGKAVVDIEAPGRYLISAHSDTMTLVPPVCIAEIG